MKIEIIPQSKQYETLLDLFPPQPANKFLPQWYKEIGRGEQVDSNLGYGSAITAKRCPAIQDLVSTGFILPIWGDLSLKTFYKEDGEIDRQAWNITTAKAYGEDADDWIGWHSEDQTKGMDIGRTIAGQTLKIKCPYKFIVPKGYDLLYTDPFYHFRKDIRCFMGLVEADKWGIITFPFEILNAESFIMKAGTPLVHVIPIKRDSFEYQLRNGTEEEYEHTNKMLREFFLTQETYKYRDYS